nr:hypothetical protein [Tanacetum cinerariifolium]
STEIGDFSLLEYFLWMLITPLMMQL